MGVPKHQLDRSVDVSQGGTASNRYELALRELCGHFVRELAEEYIASMETSRTSGDRRDDGEGVDEK